MRDVLKNLIDGMSDAWVKVSRPKSFAIAHKAIPIKPTVVQKTVLLDTFYRKLFEKL
jgi:hypothetical protein